ncbi:unnamed protein product [Ilex paraguariensis]|uniref:CCHC-type domain-containing protein n=1 Tax=Ilex paraguariensis TaxID=185542 RepID=A0ABC8S105_9AQUA
MSTTVGKQLNRKPDIIVWGNNSNSFCRGGSVPFVARAAASPPLVPAKQPVRVQHNRPAIVAAGVRCFKSGKTGHRMAECKNNDRNVKELFVDSGDLVENETYDFEQDLVFDDADDSQFQEKLLMGYCGFKEECTSSKIWPEDGNQNSVLSECPQ